MSKTWWSVVGVVALVLLGIGAWRLTGDDEEPGLRAALTDMGTETSELYVYPEWTTDGRTPVVLARLDGRLRVLDRVAERERITEPRLDVVLKGGDDARPEAVATMPGSPTGPWVAVARTPKQVAMDDKTTTERPLVWTGSDPSGDPRATAEPTRLPVDLRSNGIDGASPLTDAAVARLGSTDVALVGITQADRNRTIDLASLSTCELDDCRWRPGAVPENTPVHAVGSTRDGFIALTQERSLSGKPQRSRIWYADSAELAWEQIGTAPKDGQLALLQDGPGTATLVWRAGEDVLIQTVTKGRLRTAVPRRPFDWDTTRVETVLNTGKRWYLAGGRSGRANVALRYDAAEPVLWELRDGAWAGLDDPLLTNQPDQRIELLFTDPQKDLRAISASAVQRVYMTWRFTRETD